MCDLIFSLFDLLQCGQVTSFKTYLLQVIWIWLPNSSFEMKEWHHCPNRMYDLIFSLLDYTSTQRQVQKSDNRVLILSSMSALHDSGCLQRKAEMMLHHVSCWGKPWLAAMLPRYVFHTSFEIEEWNVWLTILSQHPEAGFEIRQSSCEVELPCLHYIIPDACDAQQK